MADAAITPIAAGRLLKQQGEVKIGSVRSPHRETVADILTPQKLASIMRRADSGDASAYLTLAQEMEERDPHYRSVLHTRKMSVSGIRPQLVLPGDAKANKQIATWVENRITKSPLFEGLIYDLLDGLGKGFSCVEILWQRDPAEWYPRGYRFVEQRHFAFDRASMSIPLLRTEDPDEDEDGEALRPYQWLTHIPKIASGIPLRTGLARTIAVCYMAKRWTAADWMAFLDVYGIPIRIGKFPAQMAGDKATLLKAVRSIGSDAAAVIPKEMEIELIESKAAGAAGVFRETIEYWDKQTSKAVLGQTMSTDDGASLAQSKTHEEVRFEISDADGRCVCQTVNEQLIKPAVQLNFGEQKTYPEVQLLRRRPEEVVPLMQATKLYVDMGGRVQASEARDRLGYDEPEEGAELLQAAQKPENDNGEDGEPGAGGNSGKKDPKEEDDDVDEADKDAAREQLRALLYDAEDDVVAEHLQDWHQLADPVVARMISAILVADNYEQARAILEELKRDHGEVLDIGALVVSLGRAMFKLRGIGNATDEVRP